MLVIHHDTRNPDQQIGRNETASRNIAFDHSQLLGRKPMFDLRRAHRHFANRRQMFDGLQIAYIVPAMPPHFVIAEPNDPSRLGVLDPKINPECLVAMNVQQQSHHGIGPTRMTDGSKARVLRLYRVRPRVPIGKSVTAVADRAGNFRKLSASDTGGRRQRVGRAGEFLGKRQTADDALRGR